MKRLITTTALALIMAGPAVAQTTQGQQDAPAGQTAGAAGMDRAQTGAMQQGDLLASELLGSPIYVPGQGQDQQGQAGQQDQAGQQGQQVQPGQRQSRWGQQMDAGQLQAMENIGTVNDLLLDEQGNIQAVLVDVGEATGTESRQIAIGLEQLHFIPDPADPNLIYLVSTGGSDMIENAPEFDTMPQQDRGMQQGGMQQDGMQQDGMQQDGMQQDGMQQDGMQQPAQDGTQQVGQDGMQQQDDWRGGRQGLVAPDVQREGYQQAQVNEISADELLNANLYDVNDDNVGNVSDVVLGPDGEAQYIVADVGGFLGIGAHTVALGFDEISIMRDDGMTDLRLYVDVNEESLRAMPEHTANN